MTQLALPVPATRVTPARLGRAGSIAAATILASVGLVVASVGIAFPVVEGVVASGGVAVSARDLAIFETILPYWGLIVLFGVVLVAGGVGALDRGRIGRVVAIAAAGLLLVPAMAGQLAGVTGALDLDVAGRVVAASLSGLAGIAILGVGVSARR
jgi:hypothetical protein